VAADNCFADCITLACSKVAGCHCFAIFAINHFVGHLRSDQRRASSSALAASIVH